MQCQKGVKLFSGRNVVMVVMVIEVLMAPKMAAIEREREKERGRLLAADEVEKAPNSTFPSFTAYNDYKFLL